MAGDAFRLWQTNFRNGFQNVPDDQGAHGRQSISQSHPHLSEAKFQRLMDDPLGQSSNFQDSQVEIGDVSSQGHPTLFSQLPLSSQQPMTGSEYHREIGQFGVSQAAQRATQSTPTTGNKKRNAKKQARKGKKAKPPVDLISGDEEDTDDGNGKKGEDADEGNDKKSWTGAKVIQLIAFKSEMDDVFKQNAKKQGINTWEKLQGRMLAACDNFCKSTEACRKKWRVVYNQYTNDKRLLQISGEGRKVTCRFFDEIDQGFNNAANVRKLCHGNARGNPNPCPPDLNDLGEGQAPGEEHDSADAAPWGENAGMWKAVSPQGSKAPKKTSVEQILSFMGNMVSHSVDMADSSRQMVTQTTRIADDIHQNGMLLKELQSQMGKLIDKL